MPRFVILEHDHPFLHWDLMLEAGDVLRTWRLDGPPVPGQPIHAEALADHRRIYLDYEGPVSGNRGKVVCWDGGNFDWQMEGPEKLILRLEGQRVSGCLAMEAEAGGRWLVILIPSTE